MTRFRLFLALAACLTLSVAAHAEEVHVTGEANGMPSWIPAPTCDTKYGLRCGAVVPEGTHIDWTFHVTGPSAPYMFRSGNASGLTFAQVDGTTFTVRGDFTGAAGTFSGPPGVSVYDASGTSYITNFSFEIYASAPNVRCGESLTVTPALMKTKDGWMLWSYAPPGVQLTATIHRADGVPLSTVFFRNYGANRYFDPIYNNQTLQNWRGEGLPDGGMRVILPAVGNTYPANNLFAFFYNGDTAIPTVTVTLQCDAVAGASMGEGPTVRTLVGVGGAAPVALGGRSN